MVELFSITIYGKFSKDTFTLALNQGAMCRYPENKKTRDEYCVFFGYLYLLFY